jgi:hypothetical protein
MSRSKLPKKSETLEVRLPYEAKTAFMARCHDDGRTASEAVRRFIEQEIADTRSPSPRGRAWWWQALAAGAIGLAVGTVAAPSLAHPIQDAQAGCGRLAGHR